jgi:uncharacterized protein YxjI
MPVQVSCSCGATYSLKDEFAGQSLKCPKCGATVQAGAADDGRTPHAHPAFARDKFLLHQKHMSISEKYYVKDEGGKPILFVRRPAHFFRQLLALAGVLVAVVLWWILIALVIEVTSSEEDSPLAGLLIFMGFLGMLAVIVVVSAALSPKRHVSFYPDESMGEKLLEVLQDHKLQLINATYTVRDPAGRTLANFKKNYLLGIFRKKWDCTAPGGQTLFVAREDSIILSLLRRVLGPFFGLLRTNFIYERNDEIIGEFNRKFTLLDNYVLDLTRDPRRTLDRRIALAMGVMLDTGERR